MGVRLVLVPSLAILVSACQAVVTPVPVTGSVSQLVGEWEGEYSSEETGRHGSILFRLDPGKDTATGDVLMTPDLNRVFPTAPERVDEPWWKYSPQVLQISFVRCADGEVTGVMKPYTDPETGDVTYTEFIGWLDGNKLSGSFASWTERSLRRSGGTWSAVRKPEPVRH